MSKLKIAVVTPRFTITGVPLAQMRFARALAARGHEVDFIIGLIDPALTAPDVPGVRVQALGVSKVRNMLGPLRRYLRDREPDVVFSAEDHLNAITLLAAVLAGSKAKISGSCRVGPFTTFSNVPFTKKWMLKQLTKLTFRRANALTCVSDDMVGQYRQIFANAPHVGVHNIIDDAESRRRMAEPIDEPWLNDKQVPVIVSAGTLTWRKGYDDLVEAVGIVTRRGRKVRLIIYGEGHKRPELEAQIKRLGLDDVVKLPGFATNPLKYFARADVFVLTSRFEGLPNVLVEAMLCGLTPVATDCPTGPREVLQGDRYGYLVPVQDPGAIADGIEQALDHPIAPDLLAEAVRPFEESAVIGRHFDLLGLSQAS